jgi:hypothetical protein
MSDLSKIEMVSLSAMAERWGISRQRVWKLSTQNNFPEPVISLKAPSGKVTHRVWMWDVVNDWRQEQLRLNT